ncbi:MAG: hypothetical protein DRG33_01550 [Deltaproteobacteria bacterium]|nr:MAG: hypothetical protein DRG33_01550 [Deltaproteobacteria bacterium]
MHYYEHKTRRPIEGFFLTGDWHVGSVTSDRALLEADLAAVRSLDIPVILMGDPADLVLPKDRRFDPRLLSVECLKDLDNVAAMQTDMVVSLLDGHKVPIVIRGNHEDTVRLRDSYDSAREIATRVGATVCGYTAVLKVFGYKILLTHGSGGAQMLGSYVQKAEKLAARFDEIDCVVMGHLHARFIGETVRMREEGARTLLLIGSGTYYRRYGVGQDCWTEKQTLRPTSLGSILLIAHPQSGLHAELFDHRKVKMYRRLLKPRWWD